MARLKMAVIGVGHLGQAHARVLAAMPDVELVGVADANPDQATAVAERLGVPHFTHFGPLLELVDAACVVVPTSHHYSVATAFLERGKSLLIEKPLAPTVEQADAIAQLAEARGCVVQVGHIERFNPAFEALAARSPQPRYIVAERHGTFTGRSLDIGVVLDLMVHDLDLVTALDGSPAVAVEALGASILGEHEDAATARVRYASGCVADLSVCRVAPQPKRIMQVWSPDGLAVVDFAAKRLTSVTPSESVRRGVAMAGDATLREAIKSDWFQRLVQVRAEPCESRHDQLTCELLDFVHCVRNGRRPRVNAADGRDAVALACRVLDSLRLHSWTADADGPRGPRQLFIDGVRRAAA